MSDTPQPMVAPREGATITTDGWMAALRSPFARSALQVLAFNMAANLLLLVGNAHAARCLGPANLGIGAQVQAAVQQAGLAFNGGFDTVAVRTIAGRGEHPSAVVRAILPIRLLIAVALACAWCALAIAFVPPGPVRMAWMLGAGLLLLQSLQVGFVFQAVERMPRFAVLSAISALLVTAAYLGLFRPGMPAGSDLAVQAVVGSGVGLAALLVALRLVGLRAAEMLTGWREDVRLVRKLMAQSWRYWLLAGLVFVYTGFPVLLMAKLQGDAAAGVLRVCLLLAGALELVFASINNLLLPRLVRWRDEGIAVFWARQKTLLRSHALIGAAVAGVACAVAPWIFGLLLGEAFSPGLLPFAVFAFARVVVFTGQIYAWGVVALRLDRVLLQATLCGAVASLALNLLLIPRFSVLGAALASLAAELVIGALAYFHERRHILREQDAPLASGRGD